jgi:hypothetical protein
MILVLAILGVACTGKAQILEPPELSTADQGQSNAVLWHVDVIFPDIVYYLNIFEGKIIQFRQ